MTTRTKRLIAAAAIAVLALGAPINARAQDNDTFKAAIVLHGSITDQSWNQTGYEAMKIAEEELGIEVAYTENVAIPDYLAALTDYAQRGYDVVIGHSGGFVETVPTAAERYPDTLFVVTNGFISGENYASVTFNFYEQGYVIGFLAARMSETGKAGYIGAQKIEVATRLQAGFEEGFRGVHPDAEILVAYTNNWDDVAKAKVAALNQLDQGVDVIFPTLDNAQVGALLALKERGGWGFGLWQDFYEDWPDTALQSAVMSYRIALVDFLRLAKEGKAEGQVYEYSIGTEAGALGTYNPAIPKEIIAEAKALIEELASSDNPL